MLDIRWIRDNPQALDEALKKRGAAPESAALIELDEASKKVLHGLTALHAAMNGDLKNAEPRRSSRTAVNTKTAVTLDGQVHRRKGAGFTRRAQERRAGAVDNIDGAGPACGFSLLGWRDRIVLPTDTSLKLDGIGRGSKL